MEKFLRKGSPRDERNVFGKRDKIARSPNNVSSRIEDGEDNIEKRKRLEESGVNENVCQRDDGGSRVDSEKMWDKLEEILKEIRTNNKENLERFENIQRELEKEREERKKEREEMKQEIRHLRDKIGQYEERLNDLENRSRRQNLIFRGIEEIKGETWEESEKKVKDVVKDKYGIELHGIARAHRFGALKAEWARPIMVKFEREKEREMILRGRRNLVGTKVFIDEDFALVTRLKRRQLFAIMKEKRREGKKAFVKFDKIEIDGEMFSWNLELDQLERLGDIPKR